MKVRDATRADYPAIGRMAEEFDRFLLTVGQKPRSKPINYVKAISKLDLLDHGGGCLIAEDRGKPAGYLIYFPSVSFGKIERTFTVTDIFVRAAHRGEGVGTLLMKELAKRAKPRRVTSILWTVWNRNPRALAFYLKLGAHPIDDEILMAVEVPKLLRKPKNRAKTAPARA